MRLTGIIAVPLIALLWHVGKQHLQHHFLALERPITLCLDLHTRSGCATAAGRQNALALNLHNTSAAIAIGAHAFFEAQMRNLHTAALSRLQNGFTGNRLNRLAIELKRDHVAGAHVFISALDSALTS